MTLPDLRPVLDRFPTLLSNDGEPIVGLSASSLPVSPISDGLINDTFALGEGFVLQRLHRIFRAEVNLDIDALTAHLRAAGVPVPRLIPSESGAPWVEVAGPDEIAGVWRIMTRLPGATHHQVGSTRQARSAAVMLGRFHGALLGVEHTFAFTRPGAHDTEAHMETLREALREHRGHRLREAVLPIAESILAQWADWGELPVLPERIGHGDPKISNLLFGPDGEAVGVVDLDTMSWAGLDIDLGDGMRSWCNASTEDEPTPRFDASIFEAAMSGYVAQTRGWLTEAERQAFVPAVERICLELSARFAADALGESYFGWDPSVAPTRGDHNLIRARGQLTLAQDVARQRGSLLALVHG